MKVLSKNSVMEFVKKTAILWVMIILILILSVISPSFFRGQNLLNIIKQASITGVIGVGMTFVLITGGIDLSVGSVMALSGTMAASVAVAEKNMPIALVILVGVGLGALCGLINGIGVSYIGFPPFIMTLGMMTIARGIPLVFTNGTPIFGLSEEFNMIANSRVLGVPSLVIFLVITVLAGHIILSKTVLGRRIYAVGGNEDAARLSGVSTAKVKLFVYVFCGILSGIAGILICSRITSGNGTVAEGYEMNAISAAVIGGVSMTGGSGNVLGMVVGAMILTIIQNSFDIMGVNSFYQNIIKGIKKINTIDENGNAVIKTVKQQIDELIEIVNLTNVADKKIGGFSGGMKQRVLLAQALLGDPKILILDEPTAGLDPKERINIRNYIAELSKDKIILFATHVVSDIECIADCVLLLKKGEIIAQGTPIELIEAMSGKVGEIKCCIDEVEMLQNKYKIGNIRQRKEGLALRIVGDELPEEAVITDSDIDLEDVYLYYFE